jgi:hypothetical protein
VLRNRKELKKMIATSVEPERMEKGDVTAIKITIDGKEEIKEIKPVPFRHLAAVIRIVQDYHTAASVYFAALEEFERAKEKYEIIGRRWEEVDKEYSALFYTFPRQTHEPPIAVEIGLDNNVHSATETETESIAERAEVARQEFEKQVLVEGGEQPNQNAGAVSAVPKLREPRPLLTPEVRDALPKEARTKLDEIEGLAKSIQGALVAKQEPESEQPPSIKEQDKPSTSAQWADTVFDKVVSALEKKEGGSITDNDVLIEVAMCGVPRQQVEEVSTLILKKLEEAGRLEVLKPRSRLEKILGKGKESKDKDKDKEKEKNKSKR